MSPLHRDNLTGAVTREIKRMTLNREAEPGNWLPPQTAWRAMHPKLSEYSARHPPRFLQRCQALIALGTELPQLQPRLLVLSPHHRPPDPLR